MAQFYQQQQNMMQSQFMPMGNSPYNLGMQNLGQGPNAGDLQPNQQNVQSSMQAKSIATMQLAFSSLEKSGDGSTFLANNIL